MSQNLLWGGGDQTSDLSVLGRGCDVFELLIDVAKTQSEIKSVTALNSDFYHISLCSLFTASCRIARCSHELHVDTGWGATGHCLHSFVCSMQRCCSQAILRQWLTLIWILEVRCYDFV